MVQVRVPTRRSADRAGSGARRTSYVSEDGDFTPPSSRPESSRDSYPFPHAEFNLCFSHDTVLPSVERPPPGEETPSFLSTPSTPDVRLPSVSVTPSGSTIRAGRDDTINGLGSQLGGLRFSTSNPSIDMANISSALQQIIAGGSRRSSPLLDPMPRTSLSPSPGRLGAQRRRSSSRPIVEKHDVRNEAPPNDRFNLPGFREALRDTKRSMTGLVGVLGSSAVGNEPDSVIQRLHSQAKNLSQFECPSRRTVGFVGESGAGKSSLLNSLLDYRDLARSSNGGGACTCVVTEFHFHEDERFAIVVEKFSEAELMPQLQSLLQDYRHFHLNRDSFSSQEEVADLEKRASIARDTFQAMFPTAFIVNNTFLSESEVEALSTLISWVQSFDQSIIHDRRSGLGLDECSSSLMQLSSDTSSERTPLWPWIKKIIVYLNAHILSRGLILVDLPGLRDLNAARRNITERYLLQCNEIFVVAAEGRATTDEGVRSVIELAKNARLSNVGIICTKSDEINPTEALKDWDGKSAANELRQKLDRKTREELVIKNLEEKIVPYEHEGVEVDDLLEEERADLRRNKRQLYTRSLQQFLITTRNAIVEQKLLDLYRHEVPGSQLKVFCASNAIYWDWREKPKDDSLPYLILSGILAIRQHCMSMVSESQYVAAKKYMRDDIGVLLGELDLWVQSGQGSLSAERRESIRNTLDTLERKLFLELCGRASKLNVANTYKREFDTKLYQPQGERVGQWGIAAKGKSDDWNDVTSYAAFCRNYGTHCTRTIGWRNWNEEMLEQMTNDLNPPWEQLQISLDRQGEEIVDFINVIFEEAEEFLDDELGDFPHTTGPITTSTLVSQKRLMEVDLQAILDDLQGDLRTLRTDALSGIRTSFIGKAMENAYDNARRESGGGCFARQKAIINAAVRRSGLFTDLLRSFKRDFDGYVANTQERMQEVVRSHFDAMRDTFDIVRSDNAALECENDPAFRSRVEERLRATKDEMRQICDAIAC
ncbi:hypothetical protein F5Y07DRAFT_389933 [Xylaria sp. FL0933]|nr:hypothetical protein F5Y07DRAFT_389933 [Xylaria sp. FL0933]